MKGEEDASIFYQDKIQEATGMHLQELGNAPRNRAAQRAFLHGVIWSGYDSVEHNNSMCYDNENQ